MNYDTFGDGRLDFVGQIMTTMVQHFVFAFPFKSLLALLASIISPLEAEMHRNTRKPKRHHQKPAFSSQSVRQSVCRTICLQALDDGRQAIHDCSLRLAPGYPLSTGSCFLRWFLGRCPSYVRGRLQRFIFRKSKESTRLRYDRMLFDTMTTVASFVPTALLVY